MENPPVSIQREGDTTIVITWSDDVVSRWTAQQLRAVCPCATCREKRNSKESEAESGKPMTLPVLSVAEARPLRIESMNPVGNYAYNVTFSDGHSSGIYPFEMLRQVIGTE